MSVPLQPILAEQGGEGVKELEEETNTILFHNFPWMFFCNCPSPSLLWLGNVKAYMIWDLSVLMIVAPCWNLMMNNRDGVPVWVVMTII